MLTSVNNCHVLQKFANMSDQSINLKKTHDCRWFYALNDTDILLPFENTSLSDNYTPFVNTIIPQSQLGLTQTPVDRPKLAQSTLIGQAVIVLFRSHMTRIAHCHLALIGLNLMLRIATRSKLLNY